ncbi:MAG: cobalamin-dependent protein [Coprothermobacterota bacterium]|nr:cobalamin-dependent protein [Coprothermobacterota bacterium]
MTSIEEVRPYGDRLNDGAIQISFSLPIPLSAQSKEAAKQVAGKLGLEHLRLIYAQDLGNSFSFYIIYGRTSGSINLSSIHIPTVDIPQMDFWQINDLLAHELKKTVTVVGATMGADAHTVGLDAILSAKGFGGESGLERYPQFKIYNLGAQVPAEEVLREIIEQKADVALISQVVTQRQSHLQNLSYLEDLLEGEELRQDLILICGGPYIDTEVALEVGFDAGFGPGTTPSQVASFVVNELLRRRRA